MLQNYSVCWSKNLLTNIVMMFGPGNSSFTFDYNEEDDTSFPLIQFVRVNKTFRAAVIQVIPRIRATLENKPNTDFAYNLTEM